jgi:hypothetical protein
MSVNVDNERGGHLLSLLSGDQSACLGKVVVTMVRKGEHAKETVSNRPLTLMNDHTFFEMQVFHELAMKMRENEWDQVQS